MVEISEESQKPPLILEARIFPEVIFQVTPGVAAGHGQLMSRQRASRRSTVPDPAGGGRKHASGG